MQTSQQQTCGTQATSKPAQQPAGHAAQHATDRPAQYPIAAIIERFGPAYFAQYKPASRIVNTFQQIVHCRTDFYGGQKVMCTACGHQHLLYHSCGSRDCPTCQNIKKEMWVDKQSAKLLDTKHFHIIFTVPKQLNPLFLHVPWVMYNLLFEAAWKAIQKVTGEQFGADAHTGMLAALHTWGSKLDLHPHLHCIVPAGVLLPSGAWKTTPNEGDYFTKGIHFTDTFRHFFHGRPSGLMGKW